MAAGGDGFLGGVLFALPSDGAERLGGGARPLTVLLRILVGASDGTIATCGAVGAFGTAGATFTAGFDAGFEADDGGCGEDDLVVNVGDSGDLVPTRAAMLALSAFANPAGGSTAGAGDTFPPLVAATFAGGGRGGAGVVVEAAKLPSLSKVSSSDAIPLLLFDLDLIFCFSSFNRCFSSLAFCSIAAFSSFARASIAAISFLIFFSMAAFSSFIRCSIAASSAFAAAFLSFSRSFSDLEFESDFGGGGGGATATTYWAGKRPTFASL